MATGQARLLFDRERLDAERIARLEPQEREGMQMAKRALAHAERLGLGASTSYRHLVDRGGEPLVSVVVAAPPNRVEAHTWWFPIVGRVPYLGFFAPERAHARAARLARDGLDTWVRPALLYSTLGWFDDPLPRALLRLAPFAIADTLIHERVHEHIFVRGDVAYNEGLATFIAHRATLGLLEGDPKARALAEDAFADEIRFGALLEELVGALEAVYAQAPSPEEARHLRATVFRRFQQEEHARLPWRTRRYAHFPDVSLSNAWIVAHRTYLADLPCLKRQLAALDGDLRAFVALQREASSRERMRAECRAAASGDSAPLAP